MKNIKSILAFVMALIVAMSCFATAFAAEIREDDTDSKNNVISGATVFTAEDTATGVLQQGDTDYYKFTVETAGLATVTIAHEANASELDYFVVEIIRLAEDNTEAVIASFKSAGNATQVASPAFGADAGDYYVKVTEGNVKGSNLEYTLSFAVDTEALCETEPNDSYKDATAIELSTNYEAKKYAATISSADDADYYLVEVPAEGFIYFFIDNDTSAKGNYKVSLLTHIEGTAGVADDKTLGTVTVAAADSTKTSPSVGVEKGSYYLKVTGIDGSTGGYNVYALFYGYTGVESEFNGSFATADSIAVSEALDATIFDADDKDYYKFTSTADNLAFTVKVAPLESNTADGVWQVKIYDAQGNAVSGAIATASQSAAGEVVFTAEGMAAGTYYIEVTAGSVVNTGYYQISIVDDEEVAPKMTFIERIKNLDWSGFIDNFNGWFLKIDFKSTIKAIGQSIIWLFSALG